MSDTKMKTVDTVLVHRPFTKINYWNLEDGRIRVRLYLETEEIDTEQRKFGVGIDGSASMKGNFGAGSKTVAPERRELQGNTVADFALSFLPELAELDYDKEVEFFYWATGKRGAMIEKPVRLNPQKAKDEKHFRGPVDWGTGTQLLPALKYLLEKAFPQKKGFYLFISDGVIEDEEKVTHFCRNLARQIEQERHPGVKFFLIGVGRRIDVEQLNRLDDMRELNEGFPDVDLWDTGFVNTISEADDLFREMVESEKENIMYKEGGRILDHQDNTVLEYADGLPILLIFHLPPGADRFKLETDSGIVEQYLFVNSAV